jgi:ribosomal-protein-alanine N-acetyltransferase
LIRKAELTDINEVVEIEKDVYDAPWSYDGFVAELYNDVSRFFVYTENGKICGYVIYWEIFDENKGINELEVINIAVGKLFQSRGIGKKLLNYVLTASKLPFVCYLDVRIDNLAAIKLYKSLGFEITGIRKNFYGKNKDAYSMSLKKCEVEYAQL